MQPFHLLCVVTSAHNAVGYYHTCDPLDVCFVWHVDPCDKSWTLDSIANTDRLSLIYTFMSLQRVRWIGDISSLICAYTKDKSRINTSLTFSANFTWQCPLLRIKNKAPIALECKSKGILNSYLLHIITILLNLLLLFPHSVLLVLKVHQTVSRQPSI